jgi:hypothetical protein
MRSAVIWAAGSVLGLGIAVVPARADIVEADMLRNLQYAQTGNGNTTSFDSAYITLRMYASSANEFDTVRAFYGGPDSPVTLTPTPKDASVYEYNPDFYTNQAAMDTAFPKGTYTYTATTLSNSDNATTMYDYLNDAYSQSQPYLAGTDYTDIQGMNPSAAFNFHFSPYVPDALTDDAELFFTIFDATTGDVVFDYVFQPSTSAGVTMPANTLLPNHDYDYDLDFSDRVFVTSTGADNPAVLGFDTRTDALFTTGAIPEPTSMALLVLGAPMLVRRGRRSR